MTGSPADNREVLERFRAAWASNDRPALAILLVENAVLSETVADGSDRNWSGQAEVTEALCASVPSNARFETSSPVMGKDVAIARWSVPNGAGTTTHGLDQFAFHSGRISRLDRIQSEPPPDRSGPLLQPDDASASFQPYQPRKFRFLGHDTIAETRIKSYWIEASHETDPAFVDLTKAARDRLPDLVTGAKSHGGFHGLAFCILHAGTAGTWLLFEWWAYQDILWRTVLKAEPGSADFASIGSAPINACVWESVIIEFERKAWVTQMLTPAPDPLAYLAATLPDGDY